jgi:hypothetical protein
MARRGEMPWYLIAETEADAEEWARAHCLTPGCGMYEVVKKPTDLWKLKEPTIVLIGQYRFRKDYFKLFDGEMMSKIEAYIFYEEEIDP